MQHQHESGESVAALERALRDLVPAPAHLDIGQTMFLAGQQFMRRQRSWQVVWPLSSACLALLSITLGALLAFPGQPRIGYVTPTLPAQADIPAVPETVPQATPEADRVDDRVVPLKGFSEPPRVAPSERHLDRLAWRDLTLRDLEEGSHTDSRAEQTSIKTIRYQDWRSLLDDLSLAERLRNPAPPAIFDWRSLLNTKGS